MIATTERRVNVMIKDDKEVTLAPTISWLAIVGSYLKIWSIIVCYTYLTRLLCWFGDN